MRIHKWSELNHKISPEKRAKFKVEARAELDRVGLAAVRKAREQTQMEIAQALNLPQSSISDMEHRADLLLSTLTKYIRALGGELEVHAVFPEATFNLASPAGFFSDEMQPDIRPQSVRRSRKKVA